MNAAKTRKKTGSSRWLAQACMETTPEFADILIQYSELEPYVSKSKKRDMKLFVACGLIKYRDLKRYIRARRHFARALSSVIEEVAFGLVVLTRQVVTERLDHPFLKWTAAAEAIAARL